MFIFTFVSCAWAQVRTCALAVGLDSVPNNVATHQNIHSIWYLQGLFKGLDSIIQLVETVHISSPVINKLIFPLTSVTFYVVM